MPILRNPKKSFSFAGTAPAPEKIKVSADPYCQKEHKDGLERKVVDVRPSCSWPWPLAVH